MIKNIVCIFLTLFVFTQKTESKSIKMSEINNKYSKKYNAVYFDGKIIENADSKSFKIIGDGFSKDKNNVFYFYKIIEDIDANEDDSQQGAEAHHPTVLFS